MTTGETQTPSGKENTVKLHLGCYQKKLHGFVNVDIREDVKPDVVDDVFTLKKFNNNSADLIYACHVLEHATFEEANAAMLRWFDVLKNGGILRLSVPDMEAVFEHYIFHKDLHTLKSFIWGSQKHPYDFHKAGWTFDELKSDLHFTGFKTVNRYDWRRTEHFYVDDYSQAYLPEISYKSRRVGDTIKGRLMSLNVEAVKG
jgi:predicted SAM-dependent methyltransferase